MKRNLQVIAVYEPWGSVIVSFTKSRQSELARKLARLGLLDIE